MRTALFYITPKRGDEFLHNPFTLEGTLIRDGWKVFPVQYTYAIDVYWVYPETRKSPIGDKNGTCPEEFKRIPEAEGE